MHLVSWLSLDPLYKFTTRIDRICIL